MTRVCATPYGTFGVLASNNRRAKGMQRTEIEELGAPLRAANKWTDSFDSSVIF